jgi:hypothetical protein
MNTYVLVGHGGYAEGHEFRLREGQFVIFAVKCGLPGAKYVFNHPLTSNLLRNPLKLINYADKKISIPGVPLYLKHAVVLKPGDLVSDHYISMYDKKNANYNAKSGIWKKTVNQKEYDYNSGKGELRKLSSIIGIKKGIFIFSVCRVKPGTTNNAATKTLKNYMAGKNVPPNSEWARNVRAYENSLHRIRTLKRKLENNSTMAIRRVRSLPIKKLKRKNNT